MNDEQFIHKMASGDASVWDDLMPQLRAIVLGACRDLGIFDALREDIVQDVALRVFTRWQSFKGQSSLGTWIYSIARHRCLDELRKRATRGELRSRRSASVFSGGSGSSRSMSMESGYDPHFETMLCVQQVLAKLESEPASKRSRQSIMSLLMYCVEHHPTTEELAHFLQASPQAAKQRKYEVRKYIEDLCRYFCGNSECSMQVHAEVSRAKPGKRR